MTPTSKPNRHQFSEREMDVLRLLGQGKTNQEIAQMLHLAHGTVKNYISRILSELDVGDRTLAALWAKQNLL